MTIRKLTGKMKKWADAYLITLNKTEAARRAGYNGDDVSLAQIGYENYRKPEIQAYMKDKIDAMAMPANEVVTRLGILASSSMADFATVESADDIKSHPYAMAIKKFRRKKYYPKNDDPYDEIELELYPADVNLERIGKHLGLFADRVEHTGPNGGPIEFTQVIVEIPTEGKGE